ncbi:unnamed protein product [Strongylus vulgaris]|uniref:Uncharacterized protein n=1 Tax=Strongylus vulgaris TaxID=40348 RepID=A0A3P7KXS0_STRVU|nr:unnamed protein product [Strongylus vulgaris]
MVYRLIVTWSDSGCLAANYIGNYPPAGSSELRRSSTFSAPRMPRSAIAYGESLAGHGKAAKCGEILLLVHYVEGEEALH